MTDAERVLDYDKLVAAYNANLDVTLRGFRPAEEMLDTWVPDDDVVRSLSSLVEAAQLCGSESVHVRVARQTLGTRTASSLQEKLSTFGDVELAEQPDAVVFSISNLQETALFRSVRGCYQQKLRARYNDLVCRRPLRVSEGQIPLRASEEGWTLAWAVRTDAHEIVDAVFEGAARGPMAAVLDYLCGIVVGLPIVEARDHAVIKLEFALRDPHQRHPVPGILLPQNADPIFRLPARLVNRLFEDYLTSTGYRPGMNFFDPGPDPSWKALSETEREQRVARVLSDHHASLGVTPGQVQVVECKHAYAVTVRFGDDLPIPRKRSLALSLERLVRQQCDGRLEVFCEEKKDLSKLRRLTEKANS